MRLLAHTRSDCQEKDADCTGEKFAIKIVIFLLQILFSFGQNGAFSDACWLRYQQNMEFRYLVRRVTVNLAIFACVLTLSVH